MFDSMITCHQSRSSEDKEVEFWSAVEGMSGLETAFASANTALVKNGIVSIERLCELMGNANRRIAGIEEVVIKEGSEANLTFFSPNNNWIINEEDFMGPYPNSPFIGKTLTGKPEGIFYSGNFQRCDIS
jgi:dihydroorotase